MARCQGFSLQVIDELIQSVEVDAGFEAEPVGDGLNRCSSGGACFDTKTGPEGAIDHLFERNAEFCGLSFQDACQIIVESQRRPHWYFNLMVLVLMSRHQVLWHP